MSNKNGRESREDALERILAETAKNPYTPKRPVRPQHSAGPAKPVVRTIPSPTKETENAKPQAAPVIKAEPKAQTEALQEAKTVQESAEPAMTSAAAKIAAIKRARQQSEQSAPTAQEKAAPKAAEPQAKAAPEPSKVPVRKAPEPEEWEAEENEYFEDIADGGEYEFEEEKKESLLDYIFEIAESAITVVLVVLLFYTYIIHVAEVDGASMEPTLYDSDKLLVRSIMYTPEAGDVIIIDNDKANLISESGNVVETEGLDKMIVKRVIATGGQNVDIDFETGKVMVDGNVLTENYISEPTTRDEYAFEYPLTVPEGYVFVMGDNRNVSMDSRHPKIGLVSEEDIVGKAFMRVYPFGEFGLIE